jgi:hypothetical protein
MEPHAKQQREVGFDPVVDTAEYRRRLREHMLASADQLDADHGPVDAAIEADVRAKLAAADEADGEG